MIGVTKLNLTFYKGEDIYSDGSVEDELLEAVQDILQQYCQTIRSSQKRSSNEQYAQKTKSFETKVGELNDAILNCLVENPPVEIDENEWQAASKASMGPAQRNRKPVSVSAT